MSRLRVPVDVAEKIGEQYGHPVVIIFALNPDEESFTVTTYGNNRRTSNLAAACGKLVAGAILGSMTEVKKEDLPMVPAQWEGKLKDSFPDDGPDFDAKMLTPPSARMHGKIRVRLQRKGSEPVSAIAPEGDARKEGES